MTTARRDFLKAAMVAGAGWGPSSVAASAGALEPGTSGETTPLIHVTDLFHPHGDPDDHFDLACAYALAVRGQFDLRGVVIDYPPDFRQGDPAVVAVAQMNWISGLAAPIVIGTSRQLANRQDALADVAGPETAAARVLIRELQAAERPVALTCVGSAADIVVAALREPELFKDKCQGVYLNSGSAHDNPDRPDQLEFNVRLDPSAYAAMFDLPCPLFWFPCWHTTEVRESGASGSFYWLPHREALADVPDGVAYYFAYMFDRSTNPRWLRSLKSPPPLESWEKILEGRRGMWSTASLLTAAGLTVTRDGEITPADAAGDDAVFRLQPVEVVCTDDGRTKWQLVAQPTRHWMLAVTDVARYPLAMTRAVATLLQAFRDPADGGL
jgi:hypothetical protein